MIQEFQDPERAERQLAESEASCACWGVCLYLKKEPFREWDRDRGCTDQLGSGDPMGLPSHQQPLNNRPSDLPVRVEAGGHWPRAEGEEHRPRDPFSRGPHRERERA